MTTTTTPQMLGWMINAIFSLGVIALVAGVYIQYGLGWAAITGGVSLISLALLVLAIFFYWSVSRVRHTNEAD